MQLHIIILEIALSFYCGNLNEYYYFFAVEFCELCEQVHVIENEGNNRRFLIQTALKITRENSSAFQFLSDGFISPRNRTYYAQFF